MTTPAIERTKHDLIEQAEQLLPQLSAEQLRSVVDFIRYLYEREEEWAGPEPEDQRLVASGLLPRLIEAAQHEAPAQDWERELDEL